MPMPPTLKPSNLPKSWRARVPQKILRDIGNRIRHGSGTALSDECIFVDPAAVTADYAPAPKAGAPKFRRYHSGMILDGDWDLSVIPNSPGYKERAIIAHFRDGEPWEETGIFKPLLADIARKGSADGMTSRAEIEARYRRLDAVYEETRRNGRMKTRRELPDYFRREHGGIFIHIARDGSPIKAGGGTHRLEVGRLLGLSKVPAQLGVIHAEAFRDGHLERLRRE